MVILKDMAIASQGKPGLRYDQFLKRLEAESFRHDQNGPLKLRLKLLESFMTKTKSKTNSAVDIFENHPGHLLVVCGLE